MLNTIIACVTLGFVIILGFAVYAIADRLTEMDVKIDELLEQKNKS